MFSGLQEILLLVLIGLGIFLIPRMMPQINRSTKGSSGSEIFAALSGKMRLAIMISVLWPLAVAFYIEPWKHDLNLFLVLGPGIVVTGWGIAWVFSGFKH